MKKFDEELIENLEGDSEEDFEDFSEDISDEEAESEEIKENNQEIKEGAIDDISEEFFEPDINEVITEKTEENVEGDFIEREIIKEVPFEEQLRDFRRNLIEASLYAAGRPLTIEELANKLEFSKKEVEELLNDVAFDYMERSTALIIAQIGDRYQMQIRPEYTEQVSKFAKGGAIAERYLRTLTVIALKQPILKSMVIKLRGTGAYEHVKYLIDNGFINAVKKGRTHELTTTDKYADMFGLPKDKTELKRAMIEQLGIEELSSSELPEENEHNLHEEIENNFPSQPSVESEEENDKE
ncbi:MAG: SMC-Scp complex subunit ScpB [Promethearchaeota archaeon]|nr:MAG: SMC-Scp complex subunit ScpB [Candidatus Lokiarchaeota archaeon]